MAVDIGPFKFGTVTLDGPFTDAQFHIEGYRYPPLRRDRDKNGGRKMIFIREGLIAKILYAYEDSTSETICLEVTISKKKWCVTFAYRPPYNSNKDGFFKELNKSLSNITRKYENVLVVGDLNIERFKKLLIWLMWYFLALKSHIRSYMRKVIGRFLDWRDANK